MFTFKAGEEDVTKYIVNANWTGDKGQAARRLDFTIAYNTKDKYFKCLDIKVGSTFYVYEDAVEIFRGIIFFRQRDTHNFTMEFTAYDYLIYLAKSKTTRKFKNITVESVINQVCNELGVVVGEIDSIGVYVDFIADEKTGIEIINQALDLAYATNKKRYHTYMDSGKLYVVEKGTAIENYVANSKVNVENTTYSESIEEMVSQILITDENGNTAGYVTNSEDVKNYGMIQDVYKLDPKQDTQTQARAMLKTIAYTSTLNGIGNSRCITGYSIIVEDEQLKGRFFIKNDRHTIENNIHKMQLELEFEEVVT